MFDFNSKTVVNKEFKKKEILNMIKADKKLKDDASGIEKINLVHVISEETLNMKCNDLCKEIYIFQIALKDKKIPIDFIKSFDKNIELHTYFIFQYEEEFKELCIYRYIEENKIKRGNIYVSEWNEKELKELPYCINICEIYNALILNLVPLQIRKNENLNCFLERFNNTGKLKREISALEKKAFKEAQPRKKFDIGREIRKQKEKLQTLEGAN